MRQRTRWMKGYMQTCVTHSRHPVRLGRELGWAGLAGVVATVAGTVTSALVYPVLMGLALYSLLTRPPGWEGAGTALFVALGLAAMPAPADFALRRRDLHRLRRLLPVLPLYYALVSAAAWLAVWELIWSPFHWNKTDHGRARTSRSGAIRVAQPVPGRFLRRPVEVEGADEPVLRVHQVDDRGVLHRVVAVLRRHLRAKAR